MNPTQPTAAPSSSLRPALLLEMDGLSRARDRVGGALLKQLVAEADESLALAPPSVMDKVKLPDSGNRHDFFSMGPYWWPDESKPDGLPYVRRDGLQNPESRTGTDYRGFMNLTDAVQKLARAWWFTRNGAYAEKIATLVRVWFLNPETAMTPHMEYAQAIPGKTKGRDIGIIDFHTLPEMLEGLALTASAGAWTAADAAGLNAWLAAMLDWLLTSKNGISEGRQHNNHGTFYDRLVVYIALWLGKTEQAKTILQTGLTSRLGAHISPDGSQPHELARTLSWNYSVFNLSALLDLARMGEYAGVDWWNHTGQNGQSLQAAARFLAPFSDPATPWPYEQVKPMDPNQFFPCLVAALRHYDVPALHAALRRKLGEAAGIQYAWQVFA